MSRRCNRVVGTANPVQRAWLAGFLAGLDAQAGAQARPRACRAAARGRADHHRVRERVRQQRTARRRHGQAARKRGLKPTVVDMADLDLADLAKAAAWWSSRRPGAKASRRRGRRTSNELMGDGAPRLDGVEFAVLALGDTAYVEFCAIGKAIDARLAALGGKRVADRVDLDLDFAAPAARWIDGALTVLARRRGRGRADR